MTATHSASNHPTPDRGSRICLAVGAVMLAAGCYGGIAAAGNRMLVLGALGISVALFAVALALSRRHPVALSAAPPQATPVIAPPATIALAQNLPMVINPPRLPAPAVAIVEPATAPAHPSPAEAALDVTALMKAPLADLLLAALCKDPPGARRIFAEAMNQAASLTVAGVPRQ